MTIVNEGVVRFPADANEPGANIHDSSFNLLHPLPLSVLALTVLAAVRFNAWRQLNLQSLIPIDPFRTSRSAGKTDASKVTRQQSDYSDPQHSKLSHSDQIQNEKKKRSKERRKRGKDVSREALVKLSRVPSRRQPGSDPTPDDAYQYDETYASSSSTSLHAPRTRNTQLNKYNEQRPEPAEPSLPDDDGASQDDDYLASGSDSRKFHRSRQPKRTLQTPLLPIQPSSYTTCTIAALSHLGEECTNSDNESNARTSVYGSIKDESRETIVLAQQRPSSPAPSNSASILSGTVSSAPSSNLSPRTPPPFLPPSHSLPGHSADSGFRMLDSFDETMESASPIWNADSLSDDIYQPIDEQTPAELGGMKASISAPTWDRSLDWAPGPHAESDLTNPVWSPRSPPLSPDMSNDPRPVEILFPSLNDPPSLIEETLDANDEIPPGGEIVSLKAELEAVRATGEQWRTECIRRSEECERIKWAWSEDLRKWNRRESELQQQLYHMMSLHNVQAQLAAPSSTKFFASGLQPASGKSGASGSSPSPVPIPTQPQLHPAFMSPTGLAPFGINPLGMVTPPASISTAPSGPSSRPNSTAPGGRRLSNNTRPSRPPSQSRDPSPFPVANSSGNQIAVHFHLNNPPRSSSSKSSIKSSSAQISPSSSTFSPGGNSSTSTPYNEGQDEELEDDEDEDAIPTDLASAILKRPASSSFGSNTSSRSSSRAPNGVIPLAALFPVSAPPHDEVSTQEQAGVASADGSVVDSDKMDSIPVSYVEVFEVGGDEAEDTTSVGPSEPPVISVDDTREDVIASR